ncbi:MAG: MATE family efflux transporter [Defluviitaleaceae bacterium]|nr:MATE family efflux transporter [Defluviitaleaceae bacterium]
MVKPDARRGEIPTTKAAYWATLVIALPAVAEMVSLALMGMIDMVMVGRLGYGSVAAVGLTGQPTMLFFSIFFALNTAVTAIIARNKGAGDMDSARSCLRHALVLEIFVGLLMTAAAVFLARPMMIFAGAEPEILEEATSYFRIISFALLIRIMTGTICAAQRACGNTKITLKVNVVAKIISVVLNFFLIEGRFGFPAMGVDGAAWSTVIASVVAFALVLHSITRKDSVLRISVKDNWRFEGLMMRSIGRLFSGATVEQVGFRFGFFAYAIVVARLGTADFAAHMIAMQLMVLSFTFADGIGIASTALVGQNLGKKRPDLSMIYGKIGLRLAFVVAIILSVTIILTRYQFPLLFTAHYETEIIGTAANLILILAAIMPIQTTQIVMGGSLRGAGDTKFVALTMVLSVGLLRPVLGFLFTFPFGWGIIGAWVAIIFDQAARLIMLFTRFARGRWAAVKI